jgi:hypothetical protein
MDAETQKLVFDPFFTTKRVDKGTGLGLAIVYGIVQQHKGWVELESAPGKGATFTVYLPVTEESIQPTAHETPAALGSGETVMVVDDQASVLGLVSEVLENHMAIEYYGVPVGMTPCGSRASLTERLICC